MYKESNFDLKEYMSIESLASFFIEEDSSLEKNDLNLERVLLFLEKEKSGASDKKKLMYDLILNELPYYWRFLQDDLQGEIQENEIKAIIDDMPEQEGKPLALLLKNKLIALLDINEDLLQSCIFYYSQFSKKNKEINKGIIIDVYKKVHSKKKSFSLSDMDLVADAYKEI